jgi:hypothetical protein
MFEKQYSIKDLTKFKNMISTSIPDGYDINIYNNDIVINNLKGKTVFKGYLSQNPSGCVIKGNFPVENILGKVSIVVVAVYIIVLFATYFSSYSFYDYQIFMMVVAAVIIMIIKRILSKNVDEIKDMLEDIENV